MKMSKRKTQQAGKISVSASGLAVANYLLKALGEKQAKAITKGMASAATAHSMKRKLARISACVESASASSSASAAA
jgi:hypothetical protein